MRHTSNPATTVDGWSTSVCHRLCVEHNNKRHAKLDKHSFCGIFIGYILTMANVQYIDLRSGLIKTCGHTTFDEAWYCTPNSPTVAHLLYDLLLGEKSKPTGAAHTDATECDKQPSTPKLAQHLIRVPLGV